MEDGDAATLSVWAPDGDVLVVTSTINRQFGSMVMVDKGLLLNNAMHAFSVKGTKNALRLEPSAANLPLPGKMPMSSMAPSIVTNKGRAITAIGGGGGSAAISALLSAISLTGDKNILGAKFLASEVNSVRFHPKLVPYEVEVEPEKDTAKQSPKIKEVLEAQGHKVVFKVREETHISGIQWDEKTNRRCAFADHRVDGAVNGTQEGQIE
ncbi:scoloptoxin SSD20 isoform X1 [Ixodes scapularis]|uniref:scoloptoxin SSD20 isoform X1 n=1 Tax=Ixodes scapularis TaxID=6945 RepID=UPI001C3862BE|nr:scoloptoxin SSD20 isoform X1 [Ixodes scapularis]